MPEPPQFTPVTVDELVGALVSLGRAWDNPRETMLGAVKQILRPLLLRIDAQGVADG